MLKNESKKAGIKPNKIEQLDLKSVFEQFPQKIVENPPISKRKVYPKDLRNNNLLVSLVKNDTIDLLLKGFTNIYYTGKRFPSTVELNHLYYFMPYRKGKGIRDLYFIKVARVGSKHEVHPDADPQDLRLVFELEFIRQLFEDFVPIDLPVWHTFKDTTLDEILKLSQDSNE